jgi:hypothetical protein
MSEPVIRRTSLALLIWAVAATVAAFVLSITVLLLLVKLHEADARVAEAEARLAKSEAQLAQGTMPAPNPAGPNRRKSRANPAFVGLQESEVVGRYHLFQEGTDVGIVTLLPDHSMINKDGTTFEQYHWEIQPDGLMTRWQVGRILFDVMVKPGVYAMHRDGSEYRRLEKVVE